MEQYEAKVLYGTLSEEDEYSVNFVIEPYPIRAESYAEVEARIYEDLTPRAMHGIVKILQITNISEE